MDPIVFLNGEFLPLSQAHISVMDRGFLFGDGVYEVLPVYHGHFFRLQEHLQRLANSLDAIRIAPPLSVTEWQAILTRLLQPEIDQSIYLQVTRGVHSHRDHALQETPEPTLFAMCTPIPAADPGIAREGVSAITLADIRWRFCNIKAITLLPNVLLRMQAQDAEAFEAILIDAQGNAIEGAASNLFVVQNGALITPPKGEHLLPGVTRDLILELAEAHGLPWREDEIRQSTLTSAEEIWLTSSTKEILPVTRLDGLAVGQGRPGKMWQRMTALYQTAKSEHV